MKKFYLLTSLLFISLYIPAQEEAEEVDPNIERVEKIQDLINRVEQNRAELSSIDSARVNEFIRKVSDRRFLLSKAKKQLSDEETRNKNLEDLFESNEIKLSELETELNIKLGVTLEDYEFMYSLWKNGVHSYDDEARNRLNRIRNIYLNTNQ